MLSKGDITNLQVSWKASSPSGDGGDAAQDGRPGRPGWRCLQDSS
jgi:hypothetical protein